MRGIVRGVGLVLGWAIALAVSAVAVVLLVPDRLDLTMTTPFAQAIAFRGAIGLASLAVGLLLLAAASLARRRRRRRALQRRSVATGAPRPPRSAPARRPRLTASVALAVVLLLTGAVQLGVLASRGAVNAPPIADDVEPPGAVTILAFNTYVGSTPPDDVAAVAIAAGAEVVALPETPPEQADAVAALLADAGSPMQVFTNDRGYSTVFTTSLLVSEVLGPYEQVPTRPGVGYVRAEPNDDDGGGRGGSAPPLIVAHPSSPTPTNMDWWLRELEYAVDLCRSTPGVIVAGDFNATLDHAPMRDLGGCIDAASAPGRSGAGAFGTWPAWVPAFLGAPIDRVLADGAAWEVSAVGVVTVGESDHRGFVARLVPVVGPG